ncbi:hypothetical protein APHWI1_0798 [Anaplasma phagocytophilum str. ApWI1]|uniref:Uncharacterized protein n=2 Tax=Anaplasma phagocytophilum TaxID=948 RepID=A0A0F3MVG2_ANAPH|nr:hypothetical protein EPHNCH_1605 [Anaplasma phagocytophilum str. NCH-1]KJV60857.1 hypothetical protein APHWEB_0720 [Anaplasma phagocytophilum str. Webster]KJV82569.1 hypothetical protein APHHGE2_0032 [Anaplasma phagocytophilum str. HGE2]KJV84696.1 hypothetical protein APHWI1_0798 [Anaplasma phagocytophilum str. ApWI1]KJV86796.1 hypothetical protein APHNYW_1303 [Anaplasma phagocytophilum str. ApNYW]KJV97901.1 hypothetical protein OTSANNIE_1567 [Anaplasma phagocytophilum str. Annie]KJZ99814.
MKNTCYLGISSKTLQRLSVLREEANLWLMRMVFSVSQVPAVLQSLEML